MLDSAKAKFNRSVTSFHDAISRASNELNQYSDHQFISRLFEEYPQKDN